MSVVWVGRGHASHSCAHINDENERHVCCSKLAGLHADIIRTPIPRRTHPFCSKAIPLLKPQCVLKAAKTI